MCCPVILNNLNNILIVGVVGVVMHHMIQFVSNSGSHNQILI